MMFKKKNFNKKEIPNHVAIIMDGNGRWAKRRGLPRHLGHQKGIKTLGDIIQASRKIGIKVLTVFAFSTENWNRPKTEITFLMDEIIKNYKNYYPKLEKEAIRIKVIGEKNPLKPEILQIIDQVTKETAHFKDFTLTFAFNYGGQHDILNATKTIARMAKEGLVEIDDINQSLISSCLYTKDLPPVDLLIRTSGEMRISNFLLWQCAYTEMYFTSVLWPDFNEKELLKAINVYQERDRRFGKIGEKHD